MFSSSKIELEFLDLYLYKFSNLDFSKIRSTGAELIYSDRERVRKRVRQKDRHGEDKRQFC